MEEWGGVGGVGRCWRSGEVEEWGGGRVGRWRSGKVEEWGRRGGVGRIGEIGEELEVEEEWVDGGVGRWSMSWERWE